MARMRISATVLSVAILVFSVSVFAFDTPTAKQSAINPATTDHQTDTDPAKSVLHGNEGISETHGQSGEGHGSGHANLGEILPLWSCIPFAGMLLSIALCPLLMPNFWHHHFGKVSAFWAATIGIPK